MCRLCSTVLSYRPMGKLSGPINIYLDTADWSYLQTGKSTSAESVLRELAADGLINLLVSDEHLIEVAGLTDTDQEKRLEYFRSFPNALRILTTADQLLRADALRLAETVAGREAPLLQLSATPISQIPLSNLLDEMQELALMRNAYYESAELINNGRKTSQHRSRQDVRSTDKMIKALASGDTRETIRQLVLSGQLQNDKTDEAEQRLNVWIEALRTGDIESLANQINEQIQASGQEIGDDWPGAEVFGTWLAQCDFTFVTFGAVFQRSVLIYLPETVRQDGKLLAAVAKAWEKRTVRAIVPTLLARAALIESIHYQPERDYVGSEPIDQLHVVYAPFAMVITCDQRNEGPLRQALGILDVAPMILRTNRLESLAHVLSESL
jgi:hypothetical protein